MKLRKSNTEAVTAFAALAALVLGPGITRAADDTDASAFTGPATPLAAAARTGISTPDERSRSTGEQASAAKDGPVATSSETSGATMLGEVIVTAQKRERGERAIDVPISLTHLSATQINDFRILSLEDVSRLTPGLLVSSFSQNSPTIAIRGANNTFQQIGVSKPVQVVLDDVFIPRNSGNVFELFDLDSIQVLKGPQGTLFGRNVTGGVIVIKTRDPELGRFGAQGQIELGNYDEKRVDASLNLPLGDRIAAMITATGHWHSGYGFDRLTGCQEDNQNSKSIRAKLLAEPTDTLHVLLEADYSRDNNGGRTLVSEGAGSVGNPRISELGFPQSYARTAGGVQTRLVWETPAGQLTSISAYRWLKSADNYSGTGVSYTLLPKGAQNLNEDNDHADTFSQELRYASPNWTAGEFVAGLYILHDNETRQLGTQSLAAQTGIPTTDNLSAESALTQSYAGFIDGTLHLGTYFDLTGGARYNYDIDTAGETLVNYLRPSGTFGAAGLKVHSSEATPRAVLTWKPTRDVRYYASVTRGYTAGGFNTAATSLTALVQPFRPETVTSYELGMKSLLLRNRLQLDAAVFDESYHDKQELVFNTVTGVLNIYNAARATVKGAETEVSYQVIAGLNVTANYGYLDTIYDSFQIGSLNNTGHPLGSSPRNKYSVSADLDRPLGALGFILASASYSYTASYFTGATADPSLSVHSYGLWNASLGYESANEHLKVTAWVKNLADVNYLLTPSTQGVLADYFGAPRTFGVTVGVSY